jgi:histidyl-tRNA synthetase
MENKGKGRGGREAHSLWTPSVIARALHLLHLLQLSAGKPSALCLAPSISYKARKFQRLFAAPMARSNKDTRPEARLPRGLGDTSPDEVRGLGRMLGVIRDVYESYGFEPLETPAIEYTDALGKFLPDQDRPNAGVFSFQDEDEQWLSLRYDLTAPLARYVAEHFDRLPKPFRRYAVGPVWRNEKPGPGRFRQFTQFDADTVGTDNVAADAEICMLAADTLEALGIPRGQYVIKVNSRKVLDGRLERAGIHPTDQEDAAKRVAILRSLDKLDKFTKEDVALLLGPGRKDASGDFTPGVGLSDDQIKLLLQNARSRGSNTPVTHWANLKDARTDDEVVDRGEFLSNRDTLHAWRGSIGNSLIGAEGVDELSRMLELWEAAGYGSQRIQFDQAVVRGLDYYTGPVFEAELTFEVKNEDGKTVRFGSVGGGGRYDDLVARFTGQRVPATGFSIGVSRLQAALAALNSNKSVRGPVVVLVMDKAELPRYQKLTQTLRQAGIRAEMYLGTSTRFQVQMKYADKRGAPCVVIQGGDELARGEVQIKDLIEGAQDRSKAAATIKDSKEWREGRPAQVSVPEARMAEAVREVLARHGG